MLLLLQEKVHVETEHGEVVVVVLGDRQKPAAVTYHDVGANCELSHVLLHSLHRVIQK